jgi:hypothetical protein
MQPKMGGKFHLKLNICTRPIANKYCEGKMKSTLKRELRARETVKGEAIGASSVAGMISLRQVRRLTHVAQALGGSSWACSRMYSSLLQVNISLSVQVKMFREVTSFGWR